MFPRVPAITTFSALLCHSLRVFAQQQLPAWEHETFQFGWQPHNSSFTRCGTIGLTWSTTADANPIPTGPYYLLAFRAGQAPYRVNLGSGQAYNYTVNLGYGGPYLISMEDSRGATGGGGQVYTVYYGGLNCTSSEEVSQSLSFRILTPTRFQCGTISMQVIGGTPPYKLIVAPVNHGPKRVEFSSGRFDYVLDVIAGLNVMFAVEDASGKGAVSEMFTVGPSDNSGCLSLASTVAPGAIQTTYPGTTSSPTNAGPSASGITTSSNTRQLKPSTIIGGAIGALVAVGLILLIIYLWRRRKHHQYHTYPQATDPTSESQHHPPSQFVDPLLSGTGGGTPAQQSRVHTWQQEGSVNRRTLRGGSQVQGGAGYSDHSQSQRYSSFSGDPRHSTYDPGANILPREPHESPRDTFADSGFSSPVSVSVMLDAARNRQGSSYYHSS